MKPIYIHSGMAGAPQYANQNDNIINILEACLINGFNLKTATSASASGGVLTLNFAANPNFEALQTVEVALADVALVNGQHRVVTNASNQVTIAIAGLPDGAVGSTGAGITIKQAGAGWSKPFSASTKAVFRPPAGSRRFLQVVNAAGAEVQARGYEDMTNVDTGTGPFPTVTQVATPVALAIIVYSVPANSPWFMVVTDKWMSFHLANAVAPVYSLGPFFFGDAAGAVVAGDTYASLIRVAGAGGAVTYLCRNYLGDAGAILCLIKDSDAAVATWPSAVVGGERFIPYAPIVESSSSVLRGVMPNTYKAHPVIPANRFLDVYSNVVGISGRVKPVAPTRTAAMTLAMSIDEEAWD